MTLANLKSNTSYAVRVFSIGGNGNGGYAQLTAETGVLRGDINADGKVDIFDYNLLVSDFGKTGSVGFTSADIDNNGKVDIFDYNILVGNFGKGQ
ncbi:hypothetical protein HY086_01030 [Candidatus Gottesmanbacteria bacterium]|nr:hypothetical protein [Candidatus Gottesmanbacteria bacterium]